MWRVCVTGRVGCAGSCPITGRSHHLPPQWDQGDGVRRWQVHGLQRQQPGPVQALASVCARVSVCLCVVVVCACVLWWCVHASRGGCLSRLHLPAPYTSARQQSLFPCCHRRSGDATADMDAPKFDHRDWTAGDIALWDVWRGASASALDGPQWRAAVTAEHRTHGFPAFVYAWNVQT